MNRPRFYLLAATLLFLLAFAITTTTTVETAQAPPQAAAAEGIIISTAPAAARPAQNPGGAPAQDAPAAAPAGDYAGEETCLGCHEDQSYKGTTHGLAFKARTPAATQGCESCHGPGRAHAESGDPALILSYSRMTPAEASETCLSCHNRASHALWEGSQHDQRNISCVTCHSAHSAEGPAQIKAENQMQLCSSCHRNVTSRQHRFSHMPVREGAMTCSSCHNVHGTQNVRLLKTGTTIDEACSSCHADKRGPHLWEHAPVAESCITCHEPHGSNNDRMLVAKQPFLCQRCHVTSRHPTTVYEGYQLNNSQNANKLFGRSCTVCHQMVHGSNAPSGKMLLR